MTDKYLSLGLYLIGAIAALEHLHNGDRPFDMMKVGAAFTWPIIYGVYATVVILEAVIQFLTAMWRRLSVAGSAHASPIPPVHTEEDNLTTHCPRCGCSWFGTDNPGDDFTQWKRYCKGCGMRYGTSETVLKKTVQIGETGSTPPVRDA